MYNVCANAPSIASIDVCENNSQLHHFSKYQCRPCPWGLSVHSRPGGKNHKAKSCRMEIFYGTLAGYTVTMIQWKDFARTTWLLRQKSSGLPIISFFRVFWRLADSVVSRFIVDTGMGLLLVIYNKYINSDTQINTNTRTYMHIDGQNEHISDTFSSDQKSHTHHTRV